MVLAGVLSTGFTIIAALLAVWSLWWIVSAARTNPGEREAEVEARDRVARGEGWDPDDGLPTPQAFTDAELLALSDALAPQTPEEAGVDVRPAPPAKRRRGRRS